MAQPIREPVKPVLYVPPPRWKVWACLGIALAIDITAVAIAQKREQPPIDLTDIPIATVEASLEPEQQPTPPLRATTNVVIASMTPLDPPGFQKLTRTGSAIARDRATSESVAQSRAGSGRSRGDHLPDSNHGADSKPRLAPSTTAACAEQQ